MSWAIFSDHEEMMPTTDTEQLARYCTVAEAAAVCGVDQKRIRNWQALGLIAPALKVGRVQYHRHDVLRCHVLMALQRVLGQDSGVAVEAAKALSREQLDRLLALDDAPTILVQIPRGEIEFHLDPETLGATIERLAAVPR